MGKKIMVNRFLHFWKMNVHSQFFPFRFRPSIFGPEGRVIHNRPIIPYSDKELFTIQVEIIKWYNNGINNGGSGELKKMMAALVVILVILLANIGVGYAGDVPEALLSDVNAQLYFGKVTKVTDTTVTILPVKKVKGDAVLNTAITYKKGHMMGGGNEQVGKTYLVGYIDEINLYYWVTDSMDPKTLKIKNASSMDLRLQGYLNNGDFEKAEEARRKKAAVTATPSALPAASPSASPMSSPILSPANTDLSLPISAGAMEKPASSLLPIIMISLIGALIIVAALALLIIRRKRNTPTE